MEGDQSEESGIVEKTEFKKPVFIGRVGKLPRKIKTEEDKVSTQKSNTRETEGDQNESVSDNTSRSRLPPAVLLKELSTPIPYKEPKWSGICPDGSYALEVLKSGVIFEQIDITTKPYYVFGRLANCHVVMAHPTISRHHAVLQYKAFAEEGEPPSGWYLYDLGSTHGTFLNKTQLKPSHYTRVRVGHQIKFGNSSRTYIVMGHDYDSEGDSELTVTEIKQKYSDMKSERDRMVKEAIEQRERDKLAEEKKREDQGIDWGMGDDAEEEPDLADNPYASTANEELYLTDPKKTLRGYFEREGHELKYDCEERGVGQFICRIELPMDDARGRPLIAEVIHKGKKKEAVIAGALEACRILDRAGLLRQAKHESRRRKERDWSADDYYDSDEDTFLDRTGAVERKRNIRMQKHGAAPEDGGESKPLTYDDLVKKVSEIEAKIAAEEKCLERLRAAGKSSQVTAAGDEDELDQFMSSLGNQGQSMAQKAEISQTKMNIQKHKIELAKTQRLAEIARPAHVPPLIKKDENTKMPIKMASNTVIYGKRIRLKTDEKPAKVPHKEVKRQDDEEFVEEVDSDEEAEKASVRMEVEEEKNVEALQNEGNKKSGEDVKRIFGPMRPPDDYVVPDSYFDQVSSRDLPEVMEKE